MERSYMQLLAYFSLLFLFACGKAGPIHFGHTTVQELLQIKGEPQERQIIPVKDGSVLIYSHDEKYQVQADVVTNAFTTPTGDQASLLYWKHRFKDCSTRWRKLPQSEQEHLPSEMELACDEQGISVIYLDNSPFVSRVIEYAKQ
jgi:hypothetical protein